MGVKKNDNLKGQGFHTNPERINKKGAPKKLPDLDEAIANVLGDEEAGKTALAEILLAHKRKAAKGDARSAELLLKYGYGLPSQKIIHSGDPENPVYFAIDARYQDTNENNS